MKSYLVLFFVVAVSAVECYGPTSETKCSGQNEVFMTCGGCEPLCSDQHPVCQPMCVRGCFCRPNFVRDDITQLCVEPQYCSPDTICKAPYEKFATCKCEFTCQNQNTAICPETCTPGCQCVGGSVRDETSGKCVLPDYCPKCNRHWR